MYLITQVFKKRQHNVPQYHCQVFYIWPWNYKIKTDVTDEIAQKFDFQFKKYSIVITHWSGSWVEKITQALQSKDKNIIVHDVSFYQ